MDRDWKEIAGDSREKYCMYLASREWSVIKRKVMERCGGVCERCRVSNATAVHHLTYIRKYKESLDDLIGICAYCHDFNHGHSDYNPAADVEICLKLCGITRSSFTDGFNGRSVTRSGRRSNLKILMDQDTATIVIEHLQEDESTTAISADATVPLADLASFMKQIAKAMSETVGV